MAARLDNIETLFGERFAHLDERAGRLEDRMDHLMRMAARSTELKRFWASALPIWTKDGRLEDRMEHLITLAQQLLKK